MSKHIPSSRVVMETRYVVGRRIRYLAFVFLIVASMPMTYWATDAILQTQYNSLWDNLKDAVQGSATFALPAIVILVLGRVIVRLLVPMPRMACPECHTRIEHLVNPRCPECGIDLPGSLVDSPEAPRDPDTPIGPIDDPAGHLV